MDDDFSDKFGLLENEVESLFQEQEIPYNLSDIRKWYNGYRIGPSSIYNPWSIIQCIKSKGKLQPYWVNTSSNELIKKLLWNGTDSFKEDSEMLLQGKSITKSIQEGIIFSDLDLQEDSTTSGSTRTLTIPNQEVLELYKEFAQALLTVHLPGSNLPKMLQALIIGNTEVFSELFQELILNAMSSHDLTKNSSEKVYHAFVLGLLVALEKNHEVKSNRESGYGRYDVCLIPKNPKDLAVIIEFKKGKKEIPLKTLTKDALKQIHEKNYISELRNRGISHILLLAIAFQGKEVLVEAENCF